MRPFLRVFFAMAFYGFTFSYGLALAETPDDYWGPCNPSDELSKALAELRAEVDSVYFFGVGAITAAEFKKRYREVGALDDRGVRRAAVTRWQLHWSLGPTASVVLSQEVWLPKFGSAPVNHRGTALSVPMTFCHDWELLQRKLIAHEQEHVNITVRAARELEERLREHGDNRELQEEIAAQRVRNLREAHRTFDQEQGVFSEN